MRAMTLDEYLREPGTPTATALAGLLGCNPDQLRQWRHGYGDRRPPPHVCVELERLTGGAVTCNELRPDLPWSRTSDKKWPNKAGRPVLDFGKVAA
jgi:transposase-like protein